MSILLTHIQGQFLKHYSKPLNVTKHIRTRQSKLRLPSLSGAVARGLLGGCCVCMLGSKVPADGVHIRVRVFEMLPIRCGSVTRDVGSVQCCK